MKNYIARLAATAAIASTSLVGCTEAPPELGTYQTVHGTVTGDRTITEITKTFKVEMTGIGLVCTYNRNFLDGTDVTIGDAKCDKRINDGSGSVDSTEYSNKAELWLAEGHEIAIPRNKIR